MRRRSPIRAAWDAVIVGGGVAGCATAIALRRFVPKASVCLIDREAADDDPYQQQIRPRIGETLPPAVVVPLQQLGIWQRFRDGSVLASAGIRSAWGAEQAYVNEHIFSPHGNGWHLDRRQFDGMLRDVAVEHGTRLITGARVLDIQRRHDQWHLPVRGGRRTPWPEALTARLVVDATGRRGCLARRLGAGKSVFDRLVGIYRFHAPDNASDAPLDSSTLIESHPHGYWYAAHLPNGQRVTALMTDADLARRMRYREADEFDQALAGTRLISQRLVGTVAQDKPVATAAHTQCLDKMSGRGWLAVGDAAFTYDPLSSLGIFKALRQSILASYAIKDALGGKDAELRKYQHVCRAEFDRYLDKRRAVYAEEPRFIHHPFWRRRLAPPPTPPAPPLVNDQANELQTRATSCQPDFGRSR